MADGVEAGGNVVVELFREDAGNYVVYRWLSSRHSYERGGWLIR